MVATRKKDESLVKDYTNCSITFTYHFSEKIKENKLRTGSVIAKKNLTTNSAIAISKQVERVQRTIIKSTPAEEHHA